MTLGSGAYLANGLKLINDGTGTVQAGNAFDIEGGSRLENAGLLQLADGSTISYVYSPDSGELLNDTGGTIEYAGGTLNAGIDVSFTNLGTVAANVGRSGGALNIGAGNTLDASDTGVYSASSGGTIDFEAGAKALTVTASGGS